MGRKVPGMSITEIPNLAMPEGQPAEEELDALYLFGCAVLWRRRGNVQAGWELVRALVSPDLVTRSLAASFLARTDPRVGVSAYLAHNG